MSNLKHLRWGPITVLRTQCPRLPEVPPGGTPETSKIKLVPGGDGLALYLPRICWDAQKAWATKPYLTITRVIGVHMIKTSICVKMS